MACTPPDPSPAIGPHWKVNWAPLAPAPAKLIGGEVAVLSSDSAITTTDETWPLAVTCVVTRPSPLLVELVVGLKVTPGEADWSLKFTCAPAIGSPRLSVALK